LFCNISEIKHEDIAFGNLLRDKTKRHKPDKKRVNARIGGVIAVLFGEHIFHQSLTNFITFELIS
jgi:hypothetical protein